jgi:hypothetical protein
MEQTMIYEIKSSKQKGKNLMLKKAKEIFFPTLIASSILFGMGGATHAEGIDLPAPTADDIPDSIMTGLKAANASVAGLDKIALAALSVGLVPLAAMLTLRFLNMVLSRV